MKTFRRPALVFLFVFMCALPSFAAHTAGSASFGPVAARSAVLVEAETGCVLYAQDADWARPAASMSKMMTEYLVLEALDDGRVSWDSPVPISSYVAFLGSLAGATRAGLKNGTMVHLRDLFSEMAVRSANDAAVALGEFLAGSETKFVDWMNETARVLGMEHSHFVNACGLPGDMLKECLSASATSGQNEMSACDAALLARALIRRHPEVLSFSSLVSLPGRVGQTNTNWMLPGHPRGSANSLSYQGVDGLKTGYTDEAGFCFTGTAVHQGLRLIAVVMGAETGVGRFQSAAHLFDYGFGEFERSELACALEPLAGLESLRLDGGVRSVVQVAPLCSVSFFSPRGRKQLFKWTFVPGGAHNKHGWVFQAPIARGDFVGFADFHPENPGTAPDFLREPGELAPLRVPIVALENVPASGTNCASRGRILRPETLHAASLPREEKKAVP